LSARVHTNSHKYTHTHTHTHTHLIPCERCDRSPTCTSQQKKCAKTKIKFFHIGQFKRKE
jgi:hypothetical protein